MMAEATRRIVLLASPGPACERLRNALKTMDGDLVLDADPTGLDIAVLQGATPQVVVVLLDPAVEDAIGSFDAILSDPAIDVLYEEASLAVAREGWDEARWSRHLAAKLLHHDDVLPPRGKSAVGSRSIGMSTLLAQPPRTPTSDANSSELALVIADATESALLDKQTPAPEESSGFDPVAAEYVQEEESRFEKTLSVSDASTASISDAPGLAGREQDNDDGIEFDSIGIVQETSDIGRGELRVEMEQIEPARASPEQIESCEFVPPATASEDKSSETPLAGLESGLALPSDNDYGDAGGQRVHDLVDLERRIANMELVATNEPGSDQESLHELESQRAPHLNLDSDQANSEPIAPAANGGGALLVLAGIGGPDAVRQLLGKLPASFPRPVLVQQRLDGGRHDRLVQQMSRATELPVHLAESETIAEAGQIYILPPTLGVEVVDGRLHFAEGGNHLIASLPASDSAVLMLSGSEDSLVEAAMALAGEGAFVAGQSPEGCYDSAAATALVARGGQSGQPAELADRVLQFWSGRG